MPREDGESEGQHPKAEERKKSNESSKREHDSEGNLDERRNSIAQPLHHFSAIAAPPFASGGFRREGFLDAAREAASSIILHLLSASLEFGRDNPI
jgi:hypothetical protein